MPVETFGERLKRLREAKKLRFVVLAAAAGRSESWVRNLESGEIAEPTLLAGVRMAQALGVPVEELAGLPAAPAPDAGSTPDGSMRPEGLLQATLDEMQATQRAMIEKLAQVEERLAALEPDARIVEPFPKGPTKKNLHVSKEPQRGN